MVEAVGAARAIAVAATPVALAACRVVTSAGSGCALTAGVTALKALFAADFVAHLEEALAGTLDTLLELRRARAVTEPLATVVDTAVLIGAFRNAVGLTCIGAIVAVLTGTTAIVTTDHRADAFTAETNLELGTAHVQAGLVGTDTLEVITAASVGTTVGAAQLVAAGVGRVAAFEGIAGQRCTAPRLRADVAFGATDSITVLVVAVALVRFGAGAEIATAGAAERVAAFVVRRPALSSDLLARLWGAASVGVTHLAESAAVSFALHVGTLA